MTLKTAALVVLVITMAWGGFAFGAVYPWAYWPLLAGVASVAMLGLLAPSSRHRRSALSALSWALMGFLLAAAIQLLPLPVDTLRWLSPETPSIVAQLDIASRVGVTTTHSLSISPARTATVIAIVATLSLCVIGAARLFSIIGVSGIAAAIAIVGTVMALTGIIQKPIYSGQIYGFWSPLQSGAHPFGPFVNQNHFAAWMLMALPVTLGLLGGHLAREQGRGRSDVRERILWLSSPDANRQALLMGAVAIMTLSLVLTSSRSGMSAGAIALVTVALSFRQRLARRKGVVAVATLSALILIVVVWAGTSAIASRFSSGVQDFDGRVAVWQDALQIVRLYPLAGTGLNTFDLATIFYQRFNRSTRYLQAHNDYLQLAAEGGLLLIVPALACIGVFGLTVRRRFRDDASRTGYWIRTGAVVGILAIALQETVDFSLQIPGNAYLFALLCAIALHEGRRRDAGSSVTVVGR